ncbi:MAG: PHP domain-containing protein, partial [Marinobacter sp.]
MTIPQDPKPCIDLHCHSTASDGALAPAELVARAIEKGVSHLALTD